MNMDDILKQASAVVDCKDCPWYRNCVTPLQLSGEDVRQLRATMEKAGLAEADSNLESFLAGMASLSESFVLQSCPVFSERLKAHPAVAQQLKNMMRSWGEGPPAGDG